MSRYVFLFLSIFYVLTKGELFLFRDKIIKKKEKEMARICPQHRYNSDKPLRGNKIRYSSNFLVPTHKQNNEIIIHLFSVTRSLTRALQIAGIGFDALSLPDRIRRRRNTHVPRLPAIVAAHRSTRFNTMPSTL